MTDGRREVIERNLEISQTESEKVIQIPNGSRVEWFSVDPYLKILKEIKSLDAPSEIFINQLRNRDSTTSSYLGDDQHNLVQEICLHHLVEHSYVVRV